MFVPPEVGRVAPWQGKFDPDASRGDLGAEPSIGVGLERKRWALTSRPKSAARSAARMTRAIVLFVLMCAVKSVMRTVQLFADGEIS